MAFSSNYRQPMSVGGIGGYQGGVGSNVPPPLPPRNYSPNSRFGAGSMYPSSYGSSGYGFGGMGYGSTGYGGYSGYSGYGGGYGGGYSGYGGYNSYNSGYGGYRPGFGGVTPENRFIQVAEESARPAFESFQSVMGMLQSVTMMFDSTFHAVHASYASVLGVADNFSRLRSMFARVFSAFSVIRGLNWLYRRLLYLVGLSRNNLSNENAWSAALSEALPDAASPGQATSSWPTVALFALLIAGPYIIMKLVSQMSPAVPPVTWNPVTQPGARADALYDFMAGSNEELSIRRGQVLMVAPSQFQPTNSGWVLACDQSRKIGMVPANYIVMESNSNLKPVAPRSGFPTSSYPSTSTSSGPSLSHITTLPTVSQTTAGPSVTTVLPTAYSGPTTLQTVSHATDPATSPTVSQTTAESCRNTALPTVHSEPACSTVLPNVNPGLSIPSVASSVSTTGTVSSSGQSSLSSQRLQSTTNVDPVPLMAAADVCSQTLNPSAAQ